MDPDTSAAKRAISDLWSRHYADFLPVPFWLITQLQWLWVRIHHLPGDKRYPSTDEELEVALLRHQRVIDLLFDDEPLVVVVGSFDPASSDLRQQMGGGPGGVEEWLRVDVDGDELHLFVTCIHDIETLQALVTKVVTAQLAHVFVCQPPNPVLYHPYDGGADLIAASQDQRKEWSTLLGDWVAGPS